MDGWIFRLDDWTFCVDGAIFHLDGAIFRVDGWIFHLDGWIFRVDGWIFHLDGWIFHLDGWIFRGFVGANLCVRLFWAFDYLEFLLIVGAGSKPARFICFLVVISGGFGTRPYGFLVVWAVFNKEN